MTRQERFYYSVGVSMVVALAVCLIGVAAITFAVGACDLITGQQCGHARTAP